MDTLQLTDIQGALDVSGLGPGIHSLSLTVTLPSDKYEMTGTVNVQVTIEDKNKEEGTEGNEDGDVDDDGQDRVPEVNQDENQANTTDPNRPSQDENEESPRGTTER